jgi:drug/metabolite transporter (DMT)-like permease
VLWQQDFLLIDFSDSRVQWAVFNCLLLGIVAAHFATVLFYLLVKKAGGLFASLLPYGIPFVACSGDVIDGEKTSWMEILCLGIILSGVYLANRPEKKNPLYNR